ncbi:uncharacterized protein LOC136071416 [Quercus suber]|uniref:uncharacterized protein LOC136071416 n=1 Tax=Quercus suber TaxID=58331 RepID=UPI0032DFCA4E
MHRFDYLVPLFVTHIRGTRIVVILNIVSDVLHVSRVEHPDYPGCERLRIVSKDELMSAFCEHPSDWGECQFTPCSAFAKGPHFLNMVNTRAGHIARRQARLGGFVESPSPSLEVSEDDEAFEDDDDYDNDDDDRDEDASSSSADEIST